MDKKAWFAATGGIILWVMTAPINAEEPANPATNGVYAAVAVNPEVVPQILTVTLSGACSGSFTLNSFTMAGVWMIPGTGSQVDAANQMVGAVGLFSYEDKEENDQLLAIMAGSFGPKYSYSLSNGKKGEAFKVTGQAFVKGQDVYQAIVGKGSAISCKNFPSFEAAVAQYPSLGADFDGFLPFSGGGAQFQLKSSKTTFELKTDGDFPRESIVSYKNTTQIAGSFETIAACKLKGTMEAPVNLSCKAGAPVNVKLSVKAGGDDMQALNL